ncbi:MAG: hypothetical protein HY908_26025, partial [Myxococcales bacterium]|nr:hypothetical protein [Myxococcales bacterium]
MTSDLGPWLSVAALLLATTTCKHHAQPWTAPTARPDAAARATAAATASASAASASAAAD